MLKRLAIIVAICSSTIVTSIEPSESISTPELCGTENSQCVPESCLQECIEAGEDPDECPHYCYEHV